MENLNYPCIYLYGAHLWIALALLCIVFIGFIIIGRSYLAAERKADGLQVKYNRCRADLSAAQLELEGYKLKYCKVMKKEVPYKVEPEGDNNA